MRRRMVLAVLLGSLLATGCLFKNRQRGALAERPLPSALAKGQAPKPPAPAPAPPQPDPVSTAANTLPDQTEYKAVPIPPPPVPEIVPVAVRLPDADATDDEKKRLLERLREKREERRDERAKETPKLPSATAPKDAPKPATGGATDGLAVAKKFYARSWAKYEKLNDYEVHMVRREVVGGKEMPTEEIQFQFRKQPFSVYMKTVGDNGKGREVLYVEGKFDGLMHVVTGKGDNIFVGAGFKTSLRPDSSMATAKSRHKITEAGAGNMLTKLDKAIKAAEAGTGSIKALGTVTRKDQPTPVDGIEIAMAPGDDPSLPKGGRWLLYFDLKADSPGYGNLAVQIMTDEKDREVEYYSFTNWKVPANLTDADFHPDRLGKKK